MPWVLLVICQITLLHAKDRFLDPDATGSADGSDWQNAWTSPAQIVWGAAGVQAGDTLYISGGAQSKVYSQGITVRQSGRAGAPITIRIGQEPGHNGKAILPGIDLGANQYLIVSGARSATFEPPTSVWQIDAIKANIGIQTTNPDSMGVFISGNGGTHVTVSWLEVGPHGSLANVGRNRHGIQFLNMNALRNSVVEYCWIHHIQNDGINLNSITPNPQEFDALTVRWTIIENTGDDGLQCGSNGLTLSHSFLRDHWQGLYNGHPDQLQFAVGTWGYHKVVNNIIRNKGNSLIIGEFLAQEGGTLGPMLVAGNIFYNTRDWVYNNTQAYGATFSAWRANDDVSVVFATWRDFYLLNNTFYYQTTAPFVLGRASPSGATRSVWRLDIADSAVENNLFVDCGYNSPKHTVPLIVHGGPSYLSETNGVYHNPGLLSVSHNIVAGASKRISYDATSFESGEAFTAATGMPGNGSGTPIMDTNGYTMALSPSDTTARNRGRSLDNLVARFPELARDLAGATRGLGGQWDIGALESAGVNTPSRPSMPVGVKFANP